VLKFYHASHEFASVLFNFATSSSASSIEWAVCSLFWLSAGKALAKIRTSVSMSQLSLTTIVPIQLSGKTLNMLAA
jgi:hypothetical protein